MKRPVTLPLWMFIIILTIITYDAFVVPFIGELNRNAAVTNLKNPATIEHNQLGQFMADTFNKVVSSGRADRQMEHSMILNETSILKNNTAIIIMLLRNGTL